MHHAWRDHRRVPGPDQRDSLGRAQPDRMGGRLGVFLARHALPHPGHSVHPAGVCFDLAVLEAGPQPARPARSRGLRRPHRPQPDRYRRHHRRRPLTVQRTHP
ncbi:hypothetical protein G6F32_016808 [Rhizopus arrhizus]|nr:hypothetical protein G6F32_016808 [Rhizopus arrhizus]